RQQGPEEHSAEHDARPAEDVGCPRLPEPGQPRITPRLRLPWSGRRALRGLGGVPLGDAHAATPLRWRALSGGLPMAANGLSGLRAQRNRCAGVAAESACVSSPLRGPSKPVRPTRLADFTGEVPCRRGLPRFDAPAVVSTLQRLYGGAEFDTHQELGVRSVKAAAANGGLPLA